MKPSQFYDFTIPANGAYTLTVGGDYFKIMRALGPVSIRSSFGELKKLVAGQGLEDSPFDRLELRDESGAANAVSIFIGDRKFIDGLGGIVDIGQARVPVSPGFVNTAATVTNASAVLVPPNPARQYLLVQNKALTGDVYISFGGAATAANGVRVVAGGFYELSAIVPLGAIHAIGSVASNPNVLVVEG